MNQIKFYIAPSSNFLPHSLLWGIAIVFSFLNNRDISIQEIIPNSSNKIIPILKTYFFGLLEIIKK